MHSNWALTAVFCGVLTVCVTVLWSVGQRRRFAKQGTRRGLLSDLCIVGLLKRQRPRWADAATEHSTLSTSRRYAGSGCPDRWIVPQINHIIERVTDAFVALDANGCYRFVNEKAAKILGRPCRELIGEHIWNSFPQGIDRVLYHAYDKAVSHQTAIEIEAYFPQWDRWFVNRVYPSRDGVSIFFHDVTDRRKADQVLQQKNDRLELLRMLSTSISNNGSDDHLARRTVERLYQCFPGLGVSYGVIDKHGVFTVTEAYRPTGMPSERGLTIDLTRAPAYLESIRKQEAIIACDIQEDCRFAPIGQIMADRGTGAVLDVPLHLSAQRVALLSLTAPGPHRWTEHEICTLKDVADLLTFALKQAHTRLLRWRAEQALRDSEGLFRAISEQMPDAMFLLDPDDPAVPAKIIQANAVAARMHGYTTDELIGMSMAQLDDESTAAKMVDRIRRLLSGEIIVFEGAHRRKDGRVFSIESSARMIQIHGRRHILTLTRDTTSRKHVQEQAAKHQAELAHALRLSTVGGLASGLAHELNQPLTAISNYTQVCVQELQSEYWDKQELIDTMSKASLQACRAATIVRRLRDFVCKREPQYSVVDVNEVINEAMEVIGADVRSSGAIISLKLQDGLPKVTIDKILVEQVILNLVKNSLDAMSEDHAPRQLTIQSSGMADDTVAVRVQDTGHGIPAGVVGKIFDEFVTTKPHGMGMGLSISRSIIDAHGGQLKALAGQDRGCSFEFTLPAAA